MFAMKYIREHMATFVAGTLVVLGLVLAFVALSPHASHDPGKLVAVVHDGDGNEQRLPLSQNDRLEVVTDLGRNVIVVEGGQARMAEADCPHGSCMQQQPIGEPGQQIICLPHKLWVEVVASDKSAETSGLNVDAVAWDEHAQTSDDVDLVAR